MEKICKNCKHWKIIDNPEQYVANNRYGTCDANIFETDIILPTDGIYAKIIETFGCIRHQYKEMKLSFDADCDGDTCLSCGS